LRNLEIEELKLSSKIITRNLRLQKEIIQVIYIYVKTNNRQCLIQLQNKYSERNIFTAYN